MKYNHVTLTFCGDDQGLEEAFKHDHFQKSLKFTRIALITGILIYCAFGVLDALLMHSSKAELWFIRYGIACPVGVAIFLFSYSSHFCRYWQVCLVFVTFVAGLGIIGMIALVPAINYYYYVGLILVLVFCYTFFRIRFIWATLTCWAMVTIYGIMELYFGHTSLPVLVSNNFFFVSANVIGMFASYSMEYYARKNFCLVWLLENEKRKTDEANEKLESKVQELKEAADKIKTLKGLLPICANCKKIRDDKGYWNQIEGYIREHAGVEFSHSICPECLDLLYPQMNQSSEG